MFCHSRVYFRTWQNQTQGPGEWWSLIFFYNRPCSDTMNFQQLQQLLPTWEQRRGGIQLWIFSSSSGKHSVLWEVDEQLGRESTVAHFEYLKEHFSPKDHPKSMCFSWKMPLKLLHSLSECLKHYMVDNWTIKPFLVTNIFQITSVLNSGL